MTSSEHITLRIEKMVYNGFGLGRHDAQVCLVKYAVPGELVTARIDSRKKQHLEATAVGILEPSPERIEPPCPLFYRCGGCQLQHMTYSQQLSAKSQAVADSLQRIGKFSNIDVGLPLASPAQLHYRIKTSLKVQLLPEPAIGLYQEKSHELLAIERCLLLHAQLNAALSRLYKRYAEQPLVKARVQFVDMFLCSDPPAVLLSASSSPRKTRSFLMRPETGKIEPCSHGALDTVGGLQFIRSPGSFYQVNAAQNEQLIALVCDLLNPGPGSRILELYCGSGNFSLFLAQHGAEVFGLESNPQATDQARMNARNNNISGCTFQKADVHRTSLTRLPGTFNKLLLNPPRSGCPAGTIDQIVKLKPDVIVYVSCNPATLARDLHLLCKAGFQLAVVQPVDMFPQTCHIETVVKLIKQSSPQIMLA